MIRDNLIKSYPRCHYNKLGKAKQTFEIEEDAQQYLEKFKLTNYSIYLCKECSKYHISKH